MHESWTHVAGAVVKARLRRAEIPTNRAKRYFGQSKMNFVSLVLHGMRAVMVFGDAVVTRMAVVCGVMAALTSMSIALALLLKVIGMATPGWVTSVTGFSLSIFLQTGILAMITLLMNGAIRVEAPAALAERARATIERIERAIAVETVPA
jgi:hypothetical protein